MFHIKRSIHLNLYIATFYIKGKRYNKSLSLTSFLSFFGIWIGITALITSMAVMNGIETETINRLLGSQPEILISSNSNDTEKLKYVTDSVKNSPNVKSHNIFVSSQVTLLSYKFVSTPSLIGILPSSAIHSKHITSHISNQLLMDPKTILSKEKEKVFDMLSVHEFENIMGDRPYELPGIILGVEILAKLNLNVGDIVDLISNMSKENINDLEIRKFHVVGVYDSGIEFQDLNTAIVHLKIAEQLKLKEMNRGVALKLEDRMNVADVKEFLSRKLDSSWEIADWFSINAQIFSLLSLEKRVYQLLSMILVIISLLNMYSSLTSLIEEKRKDIAILRSIGFSQVQIQKIFFYVASILSISGTLFGIITSYLAIVFLKYNTFESTFPGIFNEDKIPTKVNYVESAIIVFLAVLICLTLAAIISRKPLRMIPAELLKND